MKKAVAATTISGPLGFTAPRVGAGMANATGWQIQDRTCVGSRRRIYSPNRAFAADLS